MKLRFKQERNVSDEGALRIKNFKGQTFWAMEHIPAKVCPLYDCSVNKRNYRDCGDCAEVPCKMFREMKDPGSTDEEHRQGLTDRVARLKN